MEANSSKCSFHITKQIIRDKKYFVYHHKEYPVDFDLLKKNTNYFYKNQEKYKEKQNIELINEDEEYVKLSDESIQAFISSCQNEPCSIEKSSIIPLQYLAHKYEFIELIDFTDKFIENHSDELIFATLFFKIDEMKGKDKNYTFFDTSKEERFISDHLRDFIQKEEMLCLPVSFLYRILALFYQNQKNKDELKDDVTIFLFNCLDKYGKSASVLFNIIDFGEQRVEVVNRLIENYSDKFDFNLINQTLTKTVKDLTSEVNKQREEYSLLFKQMQETFNKQLEELKEMKKQEEEKQKQNEIDNKKRIENFSSDVNKIKNDVDEKMISIQDQFKQICRKQEEYIDNAVVKKYHQMILETITVGQFRRFDDKLKDHFTTELVKNEQNNKEDLSHAKLILEAISIPESYDHIQILEIFKGKIKDQSKIKITNDKIENLYQKNQLNSCLASCINISNDSLIEIEYPCNQFEQIMKIISDIKVQNEQKMKISITINDKSYFEQKNKWNKIINICKVAKSIDVIPEKAFCEFNNLSVLELSPDTITIESSSFQNCSSLTQIKIPEKVTKIGDYSFQNCSSLTKITIPTSVKSINEHCFDNCSKLDQLMINPFYTQIQSDPFSKCPFLKHVTITTARDNKSKTNERILISYNITEILYQTNFLNSSELTSYINECSEIIFEIQYPSSNFSNIYQKVIGLKQNHSSKIKIGIFYTQMETTDKYFYNNKDINFVRLDSNIKRTPNDGDDSSNGSFQCCSSLIEVFIPSSLDKIGNCTFRDCSSLKKINFELPSSVTSIGNHAFYNCTSLTQIEIPSSVTSIEFYALSCCTSLTQITIPSFVTVIEHDTFYNCTSLKQILIPPSVTSIGSCAFQSCRSLAQIEIPSSVKSIDEYAFQNCTSLTQISIPPSVTSIGNGAFYNCKSLPQISIPSSVTSIGNDAFNNCTSLTQITIPSRINTDNLKINSNATINRI